MAMFGKKKDVEAPESLRDERPQRPDLLAQRNRAQAIPAGPSRLSQSGEGGATRPLRPSEQSAPEPATASAVESAAEETAGSAPSEAAAKKLGEPTQRPANPIPSFSGGGSGPQSGSGTGKRLSVGKGISLSGEIKNCEQLLVEGEIEATLKDCESLEIAKDGLFKGSAEVKNATISGRFEGDLKVLGCLTLRSGGEVEGTVTYADLSIERGGRLRGKMEDIKEGS